MPCSAAQVTALLPAVSQPANNRVYEASSYYSNATRPSQLLGNLFCPTAPPPPLAPTCVTRGIAATAAATAASCSSGQPHSHCQTVGAEASAACTRLLLQATVPPAALTPCVPAGSAAHSHPPTRSNMGRTHAPCTATTLPPPLFRLIVDTQLITPSAASPSCVPAGSLQTPAAAPAPSGPAPASRQVVCDTAVD